MTQQNYLSPAVKIFTVAFEQVLCLSSDLAAPSLGTTDLSETGFEALD